MNCRVSWGWMNGRRGEEGMGWEEWEGTNLSLVSMAVTFIFLVSSASPCSFAALANTKNKQKFKLGDRVGGEGRGETGEGDRLYLF